MMKCRQKLARFTVAEFMNVLHSTSDRQGGTKFTFGGISRVIDLKAFRYQIWKKSTCCVACGDKGTHVDFEIYKAKPVFNMYTARGSKMTKDHIVPVSKGGSNGLSNLQPMCQECNSTKGNSELTNEQLGKLILARRVRRAS